MMTRKMCIRDRYKSTLKGYAEVLRVSHGNAPRNEGRAVALTKTVNFSSIINSFMLQQVEILSAQHKPMCKFYKSYHLDRADQKVVCCGVYLNVWGEVLPGMACDTDYDCRGVRICDSYEPIWEKIIEYNRAHERQHCTYCDDLRIKSNLIRDQKEADRETALFTAPEAMDEPSSEPMYICLLYTSREAPAEDRGRGDLEQSLRGGAGGRPPPAGAQDAPAQEK